MKKYIVYEHISPSGKVYVGQTSNLDLRWRKKFKDKETLLNEINNWRKKVCA